MKTEDREPPWRISIADGDETADLTGVTSWRLVARLGFSATVLFTDTSPTVTVDPVNKWKATVKHVWVTGETDTAGIVRGELIATWPGGREQTFPSSGIVAVTIEPSL